MKTIRSGKRLRSDGGQVTITVVLAMGIFLLGAMGFAVDMANLWFHRQSAQTAADAACTAGAMDLLLDATNGATSQGGFNPKSGAFTCSGSPSTAPCQYAALNGYNGANTTQGNDVQVSFPGSVSGVTAPDATLAPSPFIRVDVIDHAQVFFSALLSGNKTQDVRATAICGLVQAKAPIPLIILKPNCTNTFQDSGSGGVSIVGGPSRSIQVDSSNSTAVSVTGSGAVDLSKGGISFSGSDFGTFGGPSTKPSGVSTGTGQWLYPASPIGDPYAKLAAPSQPAAAPAPTAKIHLADGCPDLAGCTEYHPGLYITPIVVAGSTAIFEPGLYYFKIPVGGYNLTNCGVPGGCITKFTPAGQCKSALSVDANGVIRPSTAPGDGSHGVTFYLSGPGGAGGYGSVFFGSNAGKSGGRIIDDFVTNPDNKDGLASTCPGGALPNGNLSLPAHVPGNVLLGPCTKDGTYFASTSNASTVGPLRGLIFFQDRADGNNDGQPSMQGGGGLLITGAMYFHNCPNSPSCDPSIDYKAFLQFQGNSGSGTFLLGNITTDEFVTAGNGQLSMQLNPNAVYNVLKVALLK